MSGQAAPEKTSAVRLAGGQQNSPAPPSSRVPLPANSRDGPMTVTPCLPLTPRGAIDNGVTMNASSAASCSGGNSISNPRVGYHATSRSATEERDDSTVDRANRGNGAESSNEDNWKQFGQEKSTTDKTTGGAATGTASHHLRLSSEFPGKQISSSNTNFPPNFLATRTSDGGISISASNRNSVSGKQNVFAQENCGAQKNDAQFLGLRAPVAGDRADVEQLLLSPDVDGRKKANLARQRRDHLLNNASSTQVSSPMHVYGHTQQEGENGRKSKRRGSIGSSGAGSPVAENLRGDVSMLGKSTGNSPGNIINDAGSPGNTNLNASSFSGRDAGSPGGLLRESPDGVVERAEAEREDFIERWRDLVPTPRVCTDFLRPGRDLALEGLEWIYLNFDGRFLMLVSEGLVEQY